MSTPKPGDIIDAARDTVLDECDHTMPGQAWREDWCMCESCVNGDDLREQSTPGCDGDQED